MQAGNLPALLQLRRQMLGVTKVAQALWSVLPDGEDLLALSLAHYDLAMVRVQVMSHASLRMLHVFRHKDVLRSGMLCLPLRLCYAYCFHCTLKGSTPGHTRSDALQALMHGHGTRAQACFGAR